MYAIRSYYEQIIDLEQTINKTPCDSVVIATPIDLTRIIKINKPCTRVHYSLQELGSPNLVITSYSIHYTKLYEHP